MEWKKPEDSQFSMHIFTEKITETNKRIAKQIKKIKKPA